MKSNYGLLGNEINSHLTRLKWSQRRLARESGITSGTVSKIMRDEHRASPDTIDAIGRALGIDSLYLMNLAGIPVPHENVDPSIEYIAQQLASLPKEVREIATDSVRKQIHAFHILLKGNLAARQEETLPIASKVKELTGRIEAMAERYKNNEGALEEALAVLGNQVETLEMDTKRSQEGNDSIRLDR